MVCSWGNHHCIESEGTGARLKCKDEDAKNYEMREKEIDNEIFYKQ